MNETGALAQMETTELDRALAEIARLNAALAEVEEIRDTVVLIHEREATARQEEREACKAEIARLSEALDGALAADWSSLRETLARQEERDRLKAALLAAKEITSATGADHVTRQIDDALSGEGVKT